MPQLFTTSSLILGFIYTYNIFLLYMYLKYLIYQILILLKNNMLILLNANFIKKKYYCFCSKQFITLYLLPFNRKILKRKYISIFSLSVA